MCNNCFFLDHSEQFTAAFQLDEVGGSPAFGDCIGGIVAFVPLPTFGKSGTFVLSHRLTFEHVQCDGADRGCADFAQLTPAVQGPVVATPARHPNYDEVLRAEQRQPWPCSPQITC